MYTPYTPRDNTKLTHYTPQMMAQQYYILDTTVPTDMTADIPAMNGRQGDNMRQVSIAFTDNGEPHDLTSTSITLKVLDGEGVVKVSDKVIRLVDATGGLVLFGVPSEVYANIGTVQRAYFVLKDKTADGQNQTISTVNVSFTVMENGIDISQEDHHTYVSKLDSLINGTDSLATLTNDNKFVGQNSFKSIHVDSLSAPALDSLTSSVASASDGLSSAAANITSLSSATSSSVTSLTESLSGVSSNVASLESTASANSSAVSSLSSVVADLPTSSAGNTYGDTIASLQSTIADLSETVDDQGSSLDAASNAASQASSAAYQAQQTATSASAQVYQVSMAASNASYAASSAAFVANDAKQSLNSLVTKLKMLSIGV